MREDLRRTRDSLRRRRNLRRESQLAFITEADAKEQWIHDRGSIPIVNWSPNATIANVNAGTHDDCFTAVATYLAGYDFRIMLRMWWEFDGNWMVWQVASGQEANFVTAWQRVVGLFQAAGADNVGFWWAPTSWFNRTISSACYPGDAYVDWVGADGYNQADDTSGFYCGGNHPVQTSPLHNGWAEFWEIYNPGGGNNSLHDEFGPSKPFVVGETNTLYDGTVGGTDVNKKANWYRNVNDHASALPDMAYLHGIQFFHQNLVTTEGFNWKVDNDQTYAEKEPSDCSAAVDG